MNFQSLNANTHLLQIQHNTSLHLALLHILKHLCQILHLLQPVVRLHNTPCRKLQRLNGLLPVTNGRAHNLQLLSNHQMCHRSLNRHRLALGDTNTHARAPKPQQLHTLRIRLIIRRRHDRGMRAQSTSKLSHLLRDILSLIDGDEVLSAQLEDEVFLGGVVDADDAVTNGFGGQLDSEMAEAATGAHDDDPLAGFGVGLAEGGVDGQAGAEHGGGGGGVEAVGDRGHVVGGGEDVLLEGAGGVIAGDFL